MTLGAGEVFAGYTVVRFIGAGGMGEVYLAQHPRLPGRRDALKLLGRDISADRNFRERFLREANLASTLSHQHIVGVTDRGEDSGQLWIAMDYIDGEDAAQLLSRRYPAGMPVELVAAIVTAVGSALDYAHSKGLLHRDVKPANILLANADDPAQRRILLTDFGIARTLDDISDLTPTNTTLGTVAYSAPEQLMGEKLDGRADQYSLAATAYQLLTGTTMFPASNAAVVIGHHLSADPPRLAATRPELGALDPVLRAALAKAPQDRFDSCTDFARAFSEQAGLGIVPPAAPTAPGPRARPATPPARPAPVASSTTKSVAKKVLLSAVAVAAAAAAVLGARAWLQPGRQPASPIAAPSVSTPLPQNPSSVVPPPSASPPVFPATSVDAVLLSPMEVVGVTGSTGSPLEVDSTLSGYSELNTVTPASCSGVMLGAEHQWDSDPSIGLEAVRTKAFIRSSTSEGKGPKEVQQLVAVFESADQAQTTVAGAESQWRSCSSSGVTQGSGEDRWTFHFGAVQSRGDLASVSMAAGNIESGGRACQTAIGRRANVVVQAWACLWVNASYGATEPDPTEAGDSAGQLVAAMLENVKL